MRRVTEGPVDVLIITALPMELEAAEAAALAPPSGGAGVPRWDRRGGGTSPYLWGEYRNADGRTWSVALARPTSMGGRSTGPVAARLVERLQPLCLAMCGVCAGN